MIKLTTNTILSLLDTAVKNFMKFSEGLGRPLTSLPDFFMAAVNGIRYTGWSDRYWVYAYYLDQTDGEANTHPTDHSNFRVQKFPFTAVMDLSKYPTISAIIPMLAILPKWTIQL